MSKPDLVIMSKEQFHQYHLAELPNKFSPIIEGKRVQMKFYEKCPICKKKVYFN